MHMSWQLLWVSVCKVRARSLVVHKNLNRFQILEKDTAAILINVTQSADLDKVTWYKMLQQKAVHLILPRSLTTFEFPPC